MRLSKGLASILFLLLGFFMTHTRTQLPPGLPGLPSLAGLATLDGMKTIIHDVLQIDNTFKKCIQKKVCEEFSYTEGVEHVHEYNSVKRSWVVEPRIVKKPGRLRWIGDMIANGLSRVARRVGFLPDPNRRDDGMMGNMGKMGEFASKKFEEIPMNHVIDVMDFTTDTTDLMDRNGDVYPIVKAAGMGYSIGHKKMVWEEDGPMQGCCTAQIGPDCGSFWDHVKEYNEYNLASDSRRIKPGGLLYLLVSAALATSNNQKKPSVNVARSENMAQSTFSSRNARIDESDEDFNNETFANDTLNKICRQRHFHDNSTKTSDFKSEKGIDMENDSFSVNDLQVNQKESQKAGRLNNIDLDNLNRMPIIVFEGLPPKYPDETEEELVGSVLEETIHIPKTSVIKALRMPMVSQSGHSLVMVQMDTKENELKVLNKKSDIRSSELNLDHVGIREMNDIMWWNLVQELTVVKRVVPLQERK